MIIVRRAKFDDIIDIQNCNVQNLPENYVRKYFYYHLLSWPQLTLVAEDTSNNRIVGYVLSKMDEDASVKKGHITSIAVHFDYRTLGLAKKLMELTHLSMVEIFEAERSSLHVRVSNRNAIKLYSEIMGYRRESIEKEYYADNEDAMEMIKIFKDG
ncbi:N-alpha-acetyltransferase 11 [Bonamia ostreae]|uniref:N-alpha-acetyltransferase 11 n=1 Tax=Bonamia ostreae TaxID=126728 RepID=A0ABV2ALF7_9EUKA